MKQVLSSITVVLFIVSCSAIAEERRADPLVVRALSSNPQESADAIATLRRMGPSGVDLVAAELKTTSPAATERVRLVLDRVCRQRDCYASRLFWYTDLEAAIAAAKQSGTPILSLRLLGNLDDDLSCANSRFFRTTLYSNQEIARALRRNFVLHWESVRPAPRITVDFGDGRQIKRTITGNSAHYLLNVEGNPLDVLPGLYSPKEFLEHLERMQLLAQTYEGTPVENRTRFLRLYHSRQLRTLRAERDDLLRPRGIESSSAVRTGRPTARQASDRALSKSGVEIPLLNQFDQPITSSEWKRLAELHADEVVFDETSLALMKEKEATNDEAFRRTLANLRKSVAEDTLRNEYELHRQIHMWFIEQPPASLPALNERVYSELFLMPGDDPWLGLRPADAFSALQGGGITHR